MPSKRSGQRVDPVGQPVEVGVADAKLGQITGAQHAFLLRELQQLVGVVRLDGHDAPVQLTPSARSKARTRPGFSTVPRWWIDRMQKLRCQPSSVAMRRSATGKPGSQISDP